MEEEIRWKQRFSNYVKALRKLGQAVDYVNDTIEKDESFDSNEVLDDILKEGMIQRFECTHELACKVMNDYAEYQGITTITGSRDATREAFQMKLISNGNVWMDMIVSRNKTSHTYNESTADSIYTEILEEYYSAFLEFERNMEQKRSGKQGDFF